MSNFKVITVLGANGTMGRNVSAIFASFGKAKVYMVCRNLDKANKAVVDAYDSVRCESIKDNLIPCTYDDLSKCIPESDIVFESVKEDFNTKKEVYGLIRQYLKKDAIVCTGTSGLSIKELSKEFSNNRFYGVHMFNPPYNLSLCELIGEDNKELEDYLSINLRRTVVKTKDSPSFLANRIGFFVINKALKLAEENKDQGGVDYIDSIFGGFTGRSMSPLKTADFVGLDVHKSIVDYIDLNTHDEFNDCFKLPSYVDELINCGYLGKKTNRGLYYKDTDRNIKLVYDIRTKEYRLKNNYNFYFANEMIKLIRIGKYEDAYKLLLNDDSKEALICKKLLLEYIVYSLKISKEVTGNISACDDAMATGFAWLPPVAFIELLGGTNSLTESVNKYLDKVYIDILNVLIDEIPAKSKYDYRPYLKGRY